MKPGVVRITWPDGAPELRLPLPGPQLPGGLAARLARAGRPLNTRCAHRGACAGCTVRLTDGTFRTHDGGVIEAPADVRACQGDGWGETVAISVPARAIIAHRPQVVTTFKVGVAAAHDPVVPVTHGVRDHGLAIDVGTTTVVVALVDLVTGRIVREASSFNRQIELGDDVVTRIQIASAPSQREALRQAIVDRTLALLTRDVCASAGINPQRLAAATVAGNTTMLHLLTGTDPTSLGVAPFRAAFTHHRVLTAAELGLGVMPSDAPVHLLPGFSAYVGADLVAGSLCTGLLNDGGPTVLIDIGTNGEILLRHGDRLLATATAAGPAFEGGRLSCGTHAVPGAISHVDFPDVRFPPRIEVIPGAPRPIGICGSAYIDFLAHARRLELLLPSGRLDSGAWAALPSAWQHENGDGRGVRLAAGDSATAVTEADIAHLLQAKAAIAAGLTTLLRKAGLTAGDVRRVYLAGGFGLHLNVDNAIACGLLPDFKPAHIEVVGNTALGGAWLALIDRGILPEMTTASHAAEVVELNLEPGFEDAFIDHLLLP